MGLREKVAESLINVQACSDTGQVLPAERYADAVMEVVEGRVRELEEENTGLRDSIAARIVEEEQALLREIAKEPTFAYLNGRLSGLQRARDIAKEEK